MKYFFSLVAIMLFFILGFSNCNSSGSGKSGECDTIALLQAMFDLYNKDSSHSLVQNPVQEKFNVLVETARLMSFSWDAGDSEGKTFKEAQNEVQAYAASPLPIIATGGYVRHFHIPASFINVITTHPNYSHGIRVYLVKSGSSYNFLLAGVDGNDNNITLGVGGEKPMVNKNDPCPDNCLTISDRTTDLNFSVVTHNGVEKQAWCFPTKSGIEWRDINNNILTGTIIPQVTK